jgi:hypothetical protein
MVDIAQTLRWWRRTVKQLAERDPEALDRSYVIFDG